MILQTNSNPGTYNIKVEIIDSNNDIIDATSQSITIQPNVVTTTSLPLRGLTVSASIVGTDNNQLKCIYYIIISAIDACLDHFEDDSKYIEYW